MQPEKGTVVISKAGKDKGLKFVVLQCDGLFCLIANGKLRPIEKPKRKKLRHLQLTNMHLTEQDMATNRALRKAITGLSNFD